MSVLRVVGLVAFLGSLVACTADTADDETTSKSVSDLSDPGGMGNDVPLPFPAGPGPWNDPDWKPPTPFARDRDHDPLGPMHRCSVVYQKLYDPSRSDYIEVSIVRCD